MASNFPTAYVRVASQTYVLQHISYGIQADCSDTEAKAKDPSTVNIRIASDGQVWADQTSRQLGMLSYGQDGEMVGPV